MGQVFESDIVHCYIDLSDNGNNLLFNRSFIHTELSKRVSRIFNRYGIKYEIEPLGDKGGGGGVIMSVFWEIINAVWREIVTMPPIIIPLLARYKLGGSLSRNMARVDIELSIRSNEQCPDEDIFITSKWMGEKLIELKYLSDVICRELSSRYSLFKYDQGFELSLPSLEFWVRYKINSEQQNIFNTYRIIRLFKALKIRKKFFSTYLFDRWLVIVREDGSLRQEDSFTRTRARGKKYYLVFSSNIIQDLF